ncbi:MAG: hypothetical protein ACXADA_14675 [Candidatus Hodarchaeales archaeon]
MTACKVFPEGTIFKLDNWFSSATYLARENTAPSLEHGSIAEMGFGEMHFWN